jgi:FemAB family protein
MEFNAIKTLVQQKISTTAITVSLLDLSNNEHRKTYEKVLGGIPLLHYDHSLDWFDYSAKLFEALDIRLNSYVLIFSENKKDVCFWNLLVEYHADSLVIGSISNPIRMPIFAFNMDYQSFSIVERCVISLCRELLDQQSQKLLFFEYRDQLALANSDWFTTIKAKATRSFVRAELVVNLELTLDEIKGRLRKGHRSLILLRNKDFKIIVNNGDDPAIWSACRDFHVEYVGRQTRSDETWMIQAQQAAEGRAFIVLVYNDSEEILGFGLFSHNSYECVYSSGVYLRMGSGVGLGQAVQWAAIQEMKQRGLTKYFVGLKYFDNDVVPPTDKEKSITNFKEGISTHSFARYLFEVPFPTK